MKQNFDNNIPIYVQLVDIIKRKIISGNLKPGDRIPSVREFALEMKVNPNTMQRALIELESLNLIYTERTNGKFVTSDKNVINNYKKQYATYLTKEYITSMQNIGYMKSEIINYIEGEK